MGAETKTHFAVDKPKCIKCGKCINTCSGMVIEFGQDGYPHMKEFCTFGWQQKYVDLAKESDTEDHKNIVIYYGAPVVMLVCYDKEACWTHPESGKSSGATDATIIATHMMMEATSLGLGTA